MYLIIGKQVYFCKHCQDFPPQAESADRVPTAPLPAHPQISLGLNLKTTVSASLSGLSADSEPSGAECPQQACKEPGSLGFPFRTKGPAPWLAPDCKAATPTFSQTVWPARRSLPSVHFCGWQFSPFQKNQKSRRESRPEPSLGRSAAPVLPAGQPWARRSLHACLPVSGAQ